MKLFNFQTNQQIDVAPEEATGMILSGTHGPYSEDEIPVIDNRGDLVKIKGSDLPNALKQSWRLAPAETFKASEEQSLYDESNLQAGVAGVLRGISFGLSDVALTKMFGVKPETLEKLRRYNPYISGAAEIGGAIAPILVSGGTGLAARIASKLPSAKLSKASLAIDDLATRALQKNIPNALDRASTVSKIVEMAGKTAGSAVEGSVYGAGNFISEEALGNPDFNGESLFAHAKRLGGQMGEGALWGGLVGGVIPGVMKESAKLLLKSPESLETAVSKASQTIFGIEEEKIKKYLSNPEFYDNSLSAKEIAEKINAKVTELASMAESKRIDLETAQSILLDMRSKFYEKGTNISNAIKGADKEIKNTLKESEQKILDAIKQQKIDIKNAPIPLELLDETKDIVEKFKEIPSTLSGLSYKILDEAAQPTNLLPVDDVIRASDNFKRNKFIYGREVEGKAGPVFAGQNEKNAYRYIEEYENQLYDYKKRVSQEMTLPQLKDRIQRIDEEIKTKGKWESDTLIVDYLKSLRYSIDSYLKDAVPEYKQVMEKTRDATDISIKLNRRFGTPEQVRNRLFDLIKGTEYSKDDYLLLKRLEETMISELGINPNIEKRIASVRDRWKFATDENVALSRMQKYAAKKEALKDPQLKELQQEFKTLTEEGTLFNIGEGVLKNYRGQDLDSFLTNKLQKLEGFDQLVAKNKEVRQLKDELKKLNEDLSPYRSYLDPYKAEDRVIRAANSRSERIKAMFGKLSDLTNEDFVKYVDALSVDQAFDKTYIRGSRNVNLCGWSGAAVGAMMGAIVDSYGPSIAREFLRRISKIRGNVTASKYYQALNDTLPPEQNALSGIGVNTFKKIEDDNRRTVEAIFDSVTNYFNTGTKAAKVFTTSQLSKDFDYDTEKKRIEEYISNRNDVNQKFYSQNELLTPVIPKTLDNYFLTYQKAVDFLNSKIPKDTQEDIFDLYKPSRLDVYKFAQYTKYVEDPMSIFDEIKSGTIPPEGIEVLQNVYPAIYNKLMDEFADKLTNKEAIKKLPASKKNELQDIFNLNSNSLADPMNLYMLQNLGAKEQVEQQQKPFNQIKSKEGARSQTEISRITNKGV